MRAGLLRNYVTVEQDVGTRDAANWQMYCQRQAEIREVEGNLDKRGAIVTAQVFSEVFLRADSETVRIIPQMRMRYSDRFGNEKILDVVAVLDETGNGRKLKIECRRNAAC